MLAHDPRQITPQVNGTLVGQENSRCTHRMSSDVIAVLLPGLDGTGKLLRDFASRSPAGIRAQVVPYPIDEVLSYSELCVYVRERLPAAAPFVIVAESFSGPVAVTLASRPIDGLRGVVLAASFVTPPSLPVWRFLPWRTVFRFPAPVRLLRQLMAGPNRAMLHDIRAAIQGVSPHVLAARIRSTLTVDVRRELKAVTHPLLYIRAERDRVVPARCLHDILAVREDAVVESLDTLHAVLQHEPDAAWKLISGFSRRAHAD